MLACAEAVNFEMTDTVNKFDTVVIGLGKTGYACARFLAGQDKKFAVMDSRTEPPMLQAMQESLPDVPLILGSFDESILCHADNLLVSPGVSLEEQAIIAARQAGADIYGDVELFCQNINAPVIAITGSNGKSTVTTLVAEMLRAADIKVLEGGNLGTPVLELLDEASPDVYVLELSSFQLETITSLDAIASVILNISPDHMDRYPGLDEYQSAKERVYRGSGVKVINLDDPALASLAAGEGNKITYTLSESVGNGYGLCEFDGEQWIVKGNEKIIATNSVLLKGKHNLSNVMAAIALVESMNCPRDAIQKVLGSFPGLEHRCQWVAESENINWFNDSKGTNVGATIAAIEGLSEKENLILIAGGDGKGADFDELEKAAEGYLKAAIVMGKDGPKIGELLLNIAPVHAVDNMLMAVETAARIAKSGDIVLLSPACASLDMYENYQARGNDFIAAVKNIIEGDSHV